MVFVSKQAAYPDTDQVMLVEDEIISITEFKRRNKGATVVGAIVGFYRARADNKEDFSGYVWVVIGNQRDIHQWVQSDRSSFLSSFCIEQFFVYLVFQARIGNLQFYSGKNGNSLSYYRNSDGYYVPESANSLETHRKGHNEDSDEVFKHQVSSIR